MVSTFQALGVLLLAVLPGALYTIAREHRRGSWARGDATSQLVRFVGVSAAFHALFAPMTYLAYRHLISTHALSRGEPISWLWWLVPLGYLLVPFLLGEVTGRSHGSTSTGKVAASTRAIVGLYTATAPEPRAWDWLFENRERVANVKMRLHDDTWKAGTWSKGAFASGYPEDGDLFLPQQIKLEENGDFVVDDDGLPVRRPIGLLIRWSEVKYLEIVTGEGVETDEPSGF